MTHVCIGDQNGRRAQKHGAYGRQARRSASGGVLEAFRVQALDLKREGCCRVSFHLLLASRALGVRLHDNVSMVLYLS